MFEFFKWRRTEAPILSAVATCILCSVMLLSACNSGVGAKSVSVEKENENNTKKLVMGTSADYPPFDFRQNGEVAGFDIDVAKEIAQRLGRAIEVKDMEFSSLIPALQSGQIDFVMAGMTATAERRKNVHFTGSYYRAECALLTRDEDHYSAQTSWAGKKFGVQLGTVMEKVAKQKAQQIEALKLISLAKYPVLLEELKAKRLDGVLMEKIQAQAFSKMDPIFHLIELPDWNYSAALISGDADELEGYAIAFASSGAGPGLRDQVDRILQDLKKEGVLARLQTRWLGQYRD